MPNSINLGEVILGDRILEINVQLLDADGVPTEFSEISNDIKERARQAAQKMISEFGKKYQESVHGTAIRLSEEGMVGDRAVVELEDDDRNRAALYWTVFKSVLQQGVPELTGAFQVRPELHLAPKPPLEYYPLLETIRYKLEHGQELDGDEQQELEFFRRLTGSGDADTIKAQIAHYFLREEPPLDAILAKGEELNVAEAEKLQVAQAWHLQVQSLRDQPADAATLEDHVEELQGVLNAAIDS